jgi:hypothetical protein
MRVYVEGPAGIILDCSDDPNAAVLAPLASCERELAFWALTNALALLAGITPQVSCVATEAVKDGQFLANQRYRDDQTSDVVVRLSERLADQEKRSIAPKLSRDHGDC